jgi:hypothetical protein
MNVSDPVDLVQTVALIFVMLILAYGFYLLKRELREGLMTLRAIVIAQKDIEKRLKVLEQERDER